jgi:hypothetical protein
MAVKWLRPRAENGRKTAGAAVGERPVGRLPRKRESLLEINNKVVARYLDGRVLKGITRDFSPNRISFHVEVDGTGEMVELRCRHLKALFFVRSLDGDSSRQDLRGFVEGPAETAQGRKIAVRFRDDEFICGYTLSWSPDRDGFFLFPSDVGANNQRIYVITGSTDEVKAGVQAEALAQRILAIGFDAAALGIRAPPVRAVHAPTGAAGARRRRARGRFQPAVGQHAAALGSRPETAVQRRGLNENVNARRRRRAFRFCAPRC